MMKIYSAQEWQIKFKEQAGNNKQLLHDLECTGLIKAEESQKLEAELIAVRREANFAIEKAKTERNEILEMEADLNGYSRGVADTETDREQLKEQIVEANKIIDEIAQGSHTLERVILVKRLREALK